MVLSVPPVTVTVTDYDFAQHAHMPPVVEEDMLRLVKEDMTLPLRMMLPRGGVLMLPCTLDSV